jgi:hypothetical protein
MKTLDEQIDKGISRQPKIKHWMNRLRDKQTAEDKTLDNWITRQLKRKPTVSFTKPK